MKRIYALFLAFLLLTGTFCVPCTQAANVEDDWKLIYKNDFGKSEMPAKTYTGHFGIAEDKAYEGGTSLKVVRMENSFRSFFEQSVAIENHKNYVVTAKAFGPATDEGGTVTMYLLYGTQEGYKYHYSEWVPSKSGVFTGGAWGDVTAFFRVNVDQTEPLLNPRLFVDFNGAENYLDNLRLYELTDEQLEAYIADTKEKQKPVLKTEDRELKDDVQAEIYVDAKAAAGGDGSKEKPYSTIAEAKARVREINDDMSGNIIVYLNDGEYFQDEALKFEHEDSGTNGYRVIYKSINKGKALVSGGEKIEGMRPSEQAGVWCAPVNATQMRNLYVNGERAVRADLGEYITSIKFWDDEEDTTSKTDGIIIAKGIIKDLSKANEMELVRSYKWKHERFPLKRAFELDGNVVLQVVQPAFSGLIDKMPHNVAMGFFDRFELCGAREFLDEPGEWYCDKAAGMLYYIPKEGEDPQTAEFYADVTEKLIEIGGESLENRTQNIEFSGITFSHGSYLRPNTGGFVTSQATCTMEIELDKTSQASQVPANLSCYNAENIRFTDNVFEHLGANALSVEHGTEHIIIEGNIFQDISGSAISVGRWNHDMVADTRVICMDTRIENNVIAYTGREYIGSPGITAYWVNGTKISHNEILESNYSGISLGWGWDKFPNSVTTGNNEVSYNNIYKSCQISYDGGHVYTLGQTTGSEISNNYFHDTRPFELSFGYYHDNYSQNYHDFNNVVQNHDSITWSWLLLSNVKYNNKVHDTYVSSPGIYNERTDGSKAENFATVTDITYAPNSSWPKAARDIISAAGLTAEYKNLLEETDNYEKHKALESINVQTEEFDNQNPVSIKSGDTITLRAMALYKNGIVDSNAQGAVFETEDTDIVEIEGNKLTALSSGVATIRARYGDKEAIFYCIVDDEAVSLELIKTKSTLRIGETGKVGYILKTKYWTYTAAPNGATFETSKDYIAEVKNDGRVTAKRNGNIDVRVTTSYMGKTLSEAVTIRILDTETMNVMLKEEAVPIGTSELSFVVEKESGEQVPLESSDIFLSALKVEETAQNIAEKFDYELGVLYSRGYVGDCESTDAVSETQFVDILSKIFIKPVDQVYDNAENIPLTREKMVHIAMGVLREFYGELYHGNIVMPTITDRFSINPVYAPDVAAAIHYELVGSNDFSVEFRPKDNATMDEAAKVIYRMMNPHETYMKNGGWTSNNYTKVRDISTQLSGDRQNSGSDNENILGELLSEPGLYELGVQAYYNGNVIPATKRIFVYEDKGEKSFNHENIGADGGKYIEENGVITMSAVNNDSWGTRDELNYVYKEFSGSSMEVSATVNSIESLASSAGGGLEIRADLDENSANVNYRVRPDGTLLFVKRTKKGGTCSYSTIGTMKFPLELKLVKNGGEITGYYKQDGQWHIGGSAADVEMPDSCTGGVMLYALYPSTKSIAVAEYENLYCGIPRDFSVSEEPSGEETKAEESDNATNIDEAEELVTLCEDILMKKSTQNCIVDSGFENAASSWSLDNLQGSVSNVAKLRGALSMKLSPTNGASLKHQLDGYNARRYIFSFYAKSEDPQATVLPQLEYSALGKTTTAAGNIVKIYEKENGWKQYIGIVEAETDAEVKNAAFTFDVKSGEAIFLDEIIVIGA